MVVDLLEKQRVNIKDLVLPGTESGEFLPFNPEQFITDKDVANVNNIIQWSVQTMNANPQLSHYFPYHLASDLKIISPSMFSKLSLGNDFFELYDQRIFRGLSLLQEHIIDTVYTVSSMKLIDSQRLTRDLDEDLWEMILRRLRNKDSYHLNIDGIFYAKILFPGKFSSLKLGEDIGFSSDKLPQAIETYKTGMRSSDNKFRALDLGSLARLKVVYRLDRQDLGLLGSDWQTFLQDGQKLKKEIVEGNSESEFQQNEQTYSRLLWLVRDLKLLMADKVDITDDGIKTIMPRFDSLDPASSIPQVRKF